MMEETVSISVFFDSIMERAKSALSLVREADKKAYTEKDKLFEIIREYNKKRLEIFEENLRTREVLWCTWCNKMVPAGDTELVLVVSKNRESCGYEGGDYCFETSTELHRGCSICRQKIYAKNGWYGPYDSLAKDQASFAAYKVELREDGYYNALSNGKLREDIKLPKMPDKLFQELCMEWEIPSELGLDRSGNIANKTIGNQVFVP